MSRQGSADEALIPHDVVKATTIGNDSMIKAWREHLGLTQADLADKAGMTQPAVAQLEKSTGNVRTATLEKLANAMGIEIGQLREI